MWEAIIEARPFSGHRETMQAEVSPEKRKFTFQARDFEDAVTMTRAFQAGVASHDKIWQAPIKSLRQVSDR